MKQISVAIALCLAPLFFAPPARAQHSASLSWTASSDAAANSALGYNVYRLAGACPASGTAGFTKLNSTPVTTTTYSDTTIGPGSFCYYVTATLNGAESVPSNTAPAVILPGAPTLLKIPATT
ncbi:MAG TPA: hypothetical protein VGJ06_18655 [Candidatus Acidoferrum sp.]